MVKAISYLEWGQFEDERHPFDGDDLREDWEKLKSFGFLWKIKGFENSSDAGLMEKTVKMNDCWETPSLFIGPLMALIRGANLKLDLSKTRVQHDVRIQGTYASINS